MKNSKHDTAAHQPTSLPAYQPSTRHVHPLRRPPIACRRVPAQPTSPPAHQPTSPLIQLINLSAGYKKAKNVVRGINLEVNNGEFVGLFGTNGAGKSTILKAVMGLLYQQEGQILYHPGQSDPVIDIVKESAARRSRLGIKYLTQDARIFPGYTVKDNLLFAVDFDKETYNARIPGIIDLFPDFGEKSFLDKKGDELSGGEREKTAIAMVLLTNPRLLMLDEPSSGLSPNLVKGLLEGIRRYQLQQGNGMGVILIEQQKLFEAKNVCDSLYLLKNGSIIDLEGSDAGGKYAVKDVSDAQLEDFMLIKG